MICPYCGKENPENLDICMFCGGPLTAANEPGEEKNFLEPDYTVVEPAQPPQIPPPSETPPPQPEVLPYSPMYPPPQQPRRANRNWIWLIVGCGVIVLLFMCCAIMLFSVFRLSGRLGLNSSGPAISLPSINLNSTQASASSQDVLLFDDFSDTTTGWDSVDTADYYLDYYENSYRIMVNTNMFDSWSIPDDHVFGDVQIESEATKNGGPDDNDFGLICRYQNSDAFYFGVISSDGFYGIMKATSNSTSQLGYNELQPSNAILTGSATNHIRFDCIGNILTLYVNGQQIDKQSDTAYPSGNVGVIAGTYDTAGTDILFDNFTVLKP